jgi:hypothetical protein
MKQSNLLGWFVIYKKMECCGCAAWFGGNLIIIKDVLTQWNLVSK